MKTVTSTVPLSLLSWKDKLYGVSSFTHSFPAWVPLRPRAAAAAAADDAEVGDSDSSLFTDAANGSWDSGLWLFTAGDLIVLPSEMRWMGDSDAWGEQEDSDTFGLELPNLFSDKVHLMFSWLPSLKPFVRGFMLKQWFRFTVESIILIWFSRAAKLETMANDLGGELQSEINGREGLASSLIFSTSSSSISSSIEMSSIKSLLLLLRLSKFFPLTEASLSISCSPSTRVESGICPTMCMRICCWRTTALVNFFWQMGHEWCTWTGGFSLWTPMCVFRLPLVVKALPHTLHLKGLSPVWMR